MFRSHEKSQTEGQTFIGRDGYLVMELWLLAVCHRSIDYYEEGSGLTIHLNHIELHSEISRLPPVSGFPLGRYHRSVNALLRTPVISRICISSKWAIYSIYKEARFLPPVTICGACMITVYLHPQGEMYYNCTDTDCAAFCKHLSDC